MIRNGYFVGRARGSRILPNDNLLYISGNNNLYYQQFNVDTGWGSENLLLSNISEILAFNSNSLILKGNILVPEINTITSYYKWNTTNTLGDLIYQETGVTHAALNNSGNLLFRFNLVNTTSTNDWNPNSGIGIGNSYTSPSYTINTGFDLNNGTSFIEYSPQDNIIIFAGRNSSARTSIDLKIYNWDGNSYSNYFERQSAFTYDPYPIPADDARGIWHSQNKNILVYSKYMFGNTPAPGADPGLQLYYRESYNSNSWINIQYLRGNITCAPKYSSSGNYLIYANGSNLKIARVNGSNLQYSIDFVNAISYNTGITITNIEFSKTNSILFVTSNDFIKAYKWDDSVGNITLEYDTLSIASRNPKQIRTK